MSTRIFPLAPMSTGIRVLTWGLLLLPVAFFVSALSAPSIVEAILHGSTVLIVLVYACVWLVGRPTRFELDDTTLRIVWPLRTRSIARESVVDASVVTAKEFRNAYGYGMRVGAGGLWGGFGLLMTGQETFSMWISRTDGFVIVRVRDARPLLITPAEPERFVDAIKASLSA